MNERCLHKWNLWKLNSEKSSQIVEKILNFNEQQQSKGTKILISKEMLQILPIAVAHVKAGNTCENLLNEIRQLIYFLYQKKKLLKKILTIE